MMQHDNKGITMTNNNEEYNGWKNHETWAANLWLSNNEGLYLFCRNKTGNEIKEFTQELKSHSNTNTMFKEIGLIEKVDWNAIAKGFENE